MSSAGGRSRRTTLSFFPPRAKSSKMRSRTFFTFLSWGSREGGRMKQTTHSACPHSLSRSATAFLTLRRRVFLYSIGSPVDTWGRREGEVR